MNCMDCQADLIQQRTWLAGTAQERAAWTASGFRMLKGHGRCGNCYQKSYNRQQLPTPHFHPRIPVTPCRRCGIKGTAELCIDCSDVVADLDETARWVA